MCICDRAPFICRWWSKKANVRRKLEEEIVRKKIVVVGIFFFYSTCTSPWLQVEVEWTFLFSRLFEAHTRKQFNENQEDDEVKKKTHRETHTESHSLCRFGEYERWNEKHKKKFICAVVVKGDSNTCACSWELETRNSTKPYVFSITIIHLIVE